MTDENNPDDFSDRPGPLGPPLGAAVTAAEAAAQATSGIWHQMSDSERDAWLTSARGTWPRMDIFLRTILPAAEQIIADERREDV